MSAEAWQWLRENEPESYEQLIEKLDEPRTSLSPTGRTVFRQLANVFRWFEEHGFSLDELETKANLAKYREEVGGAESRRVTSTSRKTQEGTGRLLMTALRSSFSMAQAQPSSCSALSGAVAPSIHHAREVPLVSRSSG